MESGRGADRHGPGCLDGGWCRHRAPHLHRGRRCVTIKGTFISPPAPGAMSAEQSSRLLRHWRRRRPPRVTSRLPPGTTRRRLGHRPRLRHRTPVPTPRRSRERRCHPRHARPDVCGSDYSPPSLGVRPRAALAQNTRPHCAGRPSSGALLGLSRAHARLRHRLDRVRRSIRRGQARREPWVNACSSTHCRTAPRRHA
jgi:hypothetical protein